MINRRPWGVMAKLISLPFFWLKLIYVSGRTSLQYHNDRTEWHIGIYKVNPKEIHRMQHGVFIELAFGKPREDDIVRLEDDYGRS